MILDGCKSSIGEGPLPKKITLGCDVFWARFFVFSIVNLLRGKD